MTGIVMCVAVLAAASAFGVLQRRRSGRVRVRGRDDGKRLGAAELGQGLGERATLVQFSSAFCSPCRATRVLLTDIAAKVDGVTTVDIDAEAPLDLVRRFGILRTPTVLVLDGEGAVTTRASGLPRREQVLAALGQAVGG
jgi:thiol-disulfide isomerase/thioredoxin